MAPDNRGRNDGMSPLRRARHRLDRTQEEVAHGLSVLAPDGKGPTPGQISEWENGKRTPSLKYRRLLAKFYGVHAKELFPHLDDELAEEQASDHDGLTVRRLVSTHEELIEAMKDVARNAERILVLTGSRSRDKDYLDVVEDVLAEKPRLIHYRVLYGLPHRPVFKEHLLRLLAIRDPEDRSYGYKTLHIGIVDPRKFPERFLVVSEKEAIIIIPSLNAAENFDSAVICGPAVAEKMLAHGREAYMGSVHIETTAAIEALPLDREVSRDHDFAF